MLWIYNLPTWLLALLIMTTVLVVSLGGLLLSRHFITKRLRFSREINDAVNYFGTAIAALYSVLLGLIAVASWSSFSSVQGLVSREAVNIGVLYRDLAGYPEPMSTEMRQTLRQYTVFLVEKAWPAQQQGRVLSDPAHRLTDLQKRMLSYNPPTNGQMVAHAEAMRKYNELIELRRQRIDRVDDGLPGVLWVVVLVGGMLTISVSYFFWIEDVRFHLLLLSLLSVFIGLMIFLIAALDRPFRGEVSVSAASYETIIHGVMDVLDAQEKTP